MLYDSLIHSGYDDVISIDLEIHEYSFVLSEEMEICKIGYQSHNTTKGIPYTIQIIDSATSATLLSESIIFSSSETSFFSPQVKTNLQPGTVYTIQRIQTDWSHAGNIIGRYAVNQKMKFPYTYGLVTITSSKFHQNGGPIENSAIPYIDIVFK